MKIEMYADMEDRSEMAKKRFFGVLRLVRFMVQLNMIKDVYMVDAKDRKKSIKIRPWQM